MVQLPREVNRMGESATTQTNLDGTFDHSLPSVHDGRWRRVSSHARFEPDPADPEIPATRLAVELSDYLASAAQQLKLVIDASLDLVTLVNERGELLFVSAAVTALTGFSPEEVVGQNALVLVHPDDRAEAAVAMARLIAGEQVRHTCRILRRDGKEVWVEALARCRSALRP